MSNEEKSLPRPKKTPFGMNRDSGEDNAPLMADRMALAMSQGRLDEFLKNELPDNEYAQTLARMMMGMTGMMPHDISPTSGESSKAEPDSDNKPIYETLLKQFSERSSTVSENATKADTPGPDLPVIDKDTLDAFIRIASENHISVDWLIFRAMRLYVEEYKKTGKL